MYEWTRTVQTHVVQGSAEIPEDCAARSPTKRKPGAVPGGRGKCAPTLLPRPRPLVSYPRIHRKPISSLEKSHPIGRGS